MCVWIFKLLWIQTEEFSIYGEFRKQCLWLRSRNLQIVAFRGCVPSYHSCIPIFTPILIRPQGWPYQSKIVTMFFIIGNWLLGCRGHQKCGQALFSHCNAMQCIVDKSIHQMITWWSYAEDRILNLKMQKRNMEIVTKCTFIFTKL